MWLDRPPLCAKAQKTVKNTIDGTLKSYILTCVRCYLLINILVLAHGTRNISLALSLSFWVFADDCFHTCVDATECSAVGSVYTCVSAKRETDRQAVVGKSVWDFSHLESAHVSGIPCILQTVLIALEEELEEESEREHKTNAKAISSTVSSDTVAEGFITNGAVHQKTNVTLHPFGRGWVGEGGGEVSAFHSLAIKIISLFLISSPHVSSRVFPDTHLPLTYRKSLDIPPTSLIPGHPLCN